MVPSSRTAAVPALLVKIFAIAVLYVATAKLGFALAAPPGNVTAVFPPSGIALAALLIWGDRVWPGIWIGSFVANTWFFSDLSNMFSGPALSISTAIGFGSTLQAIVGAKLIRRFVHSVRPFARSVDVVRFASIAALACTVAATTGLLCLRAGGLVPWNAFLRTWTTWYLGDLIGVLTVTPLLTCWSRPLAARWSQARALEASLLAVSMILAGRVILGGSSYGSFVTHPRDSLFLPLVAWAAVRFGPLGVTLAVAGESAVAIAAAFLVSGPFSFASRESLLWLQFFTGSVALTGLLIATSIREHQEAQRGLRASQQELERRVESRTEGLRRAKEEYRALATRVQEVREHERARMAREVHDELGQALTGLKMELGWTAKQLSRAEGAGAQSPDDNFKEMTGRIDEMIDSVRRIASDLRPGILDDLGLVAALEWQSRDFERRTGMSCDLATMKHEVELDRGAATAVFRIFQEILTNTARHAGATGVGARLATHEDDLILEVQDDGRGITREEIACRDSLGLLGMRERAALFGGEVRIVGAPGRGTTVTVRIPRAGIDRGDVTGEAI